MMTRMLGGRGMSPPRIEWRWVVVAPAAPASGEHGTALCMTAVWCWRPWARHAIYRPLAPAAPAAASRSAPGTVRPGGLTGDFISERRQTVGAGDAVME